MAKKINLLIVIMFCFSCKNLKKSEYFQSFNYGIIIKKTGNNILVFCNPIKVSRYDCSLYFSGNLNQGGFSKGVFLRNSERKGVVFDTIQNSTNNYIYMKFQENKLIVKCVTLQAGCELIFPNSIDKQKTDTLVLKKIETKILGIAIPKRLIKIKISKQIIELDHKPMLVLKETNDSIDVFYNQITQTKLESNFSKVKGRILKKDCSIIK
jgi:hypothetical protein